MVVVWLIICFIVVIAMAAVAIWNGLAYLVVLAIFGIIILASFAVSIGEYLFGKDSHVRIRIR